MANKSVHDLCANGETQEALRRIDDHLVSLDQRDTLQRTPLHRATSEQHADLVVALLERGAPVNAQEYEGWMPLHWASYRDNLELTRVLLQWGADPTIKNNHDQTPRDIYRGKGSEIPALLEQHEMQADIKPARRDK
mmetsp:Transcript_7097/g.9614  ORF Transcript_7097/g.9614 Transcript_7097/m.9614 type:complete len:137 (+) Transcript_7097:325-735(+)|eukprot:CAMPEP_0201494142 /NCGR_PEP_ID=MMETSP0151_2-20130828/45341_1 /ASSEMBLY_ACC=CAM_ASM_000257 /TAXON_ID=200890 /ORGANISM="Paramoeba atlantica, Strain 621/1 / CCAP 1560/9" /LENGTH=136 /DNA_ID=CAMNT_0047882175 /DNA_START=128 /DNA_END=538 /DNA_ORIENTATION=+